MQRTTVDVKRIFRDGNTVKVMVGQHNFYLPWYDTERHDVYIPIGV